MAELTVEVVEHTEINLISVTSGGHTADITQGMDILDTDVSKDALTSIDSVAHTHTLTNAGTANWIAVALERYGTINVPVNAVSAGGVAMTRIADQRNGYFGQNDAANQLWVAVNPAGWDDTVEITCDTTQTTNLNIGVISGYADTQDPGVIDSGAREWLTGTRTISVTNAGANPALCVFLFRPAGAADSATSLVLSGSGGTATSMKIMEADVVTNSHSHNVTLSVGGQAQWAVFADDGTEYLQSSTVALTDPVFSQDDIRVTLS